MSLNISKVTSEGKGHEADNTCLRGVLNSCNFMYSKIIISMKWIMQLSNKASSADVQYIIILHQSLKSWNVFSHRPSISAFVNI